MAAALFNNPHAQSVSMSEPIYDEICNKVIACYPDACILFVQKVVNPGLFARYDDYRATLDDHNAAKEGAGWHGTKARLIPVITREGFDPTKNVVSAYGKGTYIARDASYSKNYTDVDGDEVSYMFYCKFAYESQIMAGSFASQRTLLDEAAAGRAIIGVDRANDPTIFVIPQADAVVPEFVVAFHKYAR